MENTSFTNGSQGPLPQTGFFTIEQWSTFFGVEKKTVMENLTRCKIRVIRFGRAVVINAEWFWADLLKSGNTGEDNV